MKRKIKEKEEKNKKTKIDEERYIKLIEKHPSNFLRFPDNVKKNEKVFTFFYNSSTFQDLSKYLKPSDVVYAIENFDFYLSNFVFGFENNFEVVKSGIKKCAWDVEFASKELKNNREIVICAIKKDGDVLIYVDPKFGDDKEIVMLALDNYEYNPIEYCISDRLMNDKEVVRRIVETNGELLTCSFFYDVLNKYKKKEDKLKLLDCFFGNNLKNVKKTDIKFKFNYE